MLPPKVREYINWKRELCETHYKYLPEVQLPQEAQQRFMRDVEKNIERIIRHWR